jgi:non-ribosomal peptide synthetase component F
VVNTVILRTNLGGNPTPREVLRRVRETTLAAFANQDFPFEELIPDLKGERHLKPLAQANTMILLQNATLRPVAGADHGLRFEEANPNTLTPLVTVSSYDIIIMLREGRNGLVGTCVYKPHLFEAEMIDRLLSEFNEVLERMTTQPERRISELDLSLNERTSHG